MGVDYLSVGGRQLVETRLGQCQPPYISTPPLLTNPLTKLSHGVEFVYNLTIADTYDAKYRMLDGTCCPSETSLVEALQEVINHNQGDDRKLAQYSDAELHAIAQRDNSGQTEDDTDQDAYEAWREAKRGPLAGGFVHVQRCRLAARARVRVLGQGTAAKPSRRVWRRPGGPA